MYGYSRARGNREICCSRAGLLGTLVDPIVQAGAVALTVSLKSQLAGRSHYLPRDLDSVELHTDAWIR